MIFHSYVSVPEGRQEVYEYCHNSWLRCKVGLMDCTLPCRSLLDKICLFWTACFASYQYQPRHTGNSWEFCATFCVCPGAFQGAIYLILREVIWPLQSPPTLRLGLDELSRILPRYGRSGNFGTSNCLRSRKQFHCL